MELARNSFRCVNVSSDATTAKMKSEKADHAFVFDRFVFFSVCLLFFSFPFFFYLLFSFFIIYIYIITCDFECVYSVFDTDATQEEVLWTYAQTIVIPVLTSGFLLVVSSTLGSISALSHINCPPRYITSLRKTWFRFGPLVRAIMSSYIIILRQQ